MSQLPKIILIFLAVDWPIFMRRPMIIALAEAARKYGVTVVAVNRPLCPISTAIKKPHRIRELFGKPKLEKLTENLYLYSPRYFIHDFVANRLGIFKKINISLLNKAYFRLTEQLKIDEPAPLVWYYYPQQAYVTMLFSGSFYIYEIYDILTDIKGNDDKYMLHLENKYRERVNLVLATSQDIHNRYGVNYKNSLIFGNGLSRETFNKLADDTLTPSPEIMKINSPRIGYAGMISDRLDWGLISEMAEMKPEWNFVFAGNMDNKNFPAATRMFSNIHFTGTYDHNQTPSILKAFDVGILPYLDTEFFWSIRPLKFFEYAAAGLPIVSTRIDQLKEFSPVLVKSVTNQAEKWIAVIETQLRADKMITKKIGTEVASRFIWEDMCADLLEKIRNYL